MLLLVVVDGVCVGRGLRGGVVVWSGGGATVWG